MPAYGYGHSKEPGKAGMGVHWVWGWDEITWFSQLPEEARNAWLQDAWKWVREHDPEGYLQMPGGRCLAGSPEKKWWYYVNRKSDATPEGFGQEDTIREIWAGVGEPGNLVQKREMPRTSNLFNRPESNSLNL